MSFAIERLEEPLSPNDLSAIADVAMAAFLDDPFFTFLSPSERQRRRGLRIFFGSFVRYLGPGRAVWVARHDGAIVGISAWAEPEKYPAPFRDQILQSLQAFRALFVRPKALIDGLRYIMAIDHEHPKEPVWYLALLAVIPDHQRKGMGKELMAPVLEICDREGYDVYLETQKEDNLAYYRRVGCDVVNVLHPVKNGPPLWTLRRPTKA